MLKNAQAPWGVVPHLVPESWHVKNRHIIDLHPVNLGTEAEQCATPNLEPS